MAYGDECSYTLFHSDARTLHTAPQPSLQSFVRRVASGEVQRSLNTEAGEGRLRDWRMARKVLRRRHPSPGPSIPPFRE